MGRSFENIGLGGCSRSRKIACFEDLVDIFVTLLVGAEVGVTFKSVRLRILI